jgi:hypothetical protein
MDALKPSFLASSLLDLHPKWVMMQMNVENVLNIILNWTTIFRKLWNIKGLLANIIPFAKLFYGAQFFFTTSMNNIRKNSPLLNHLEAQSKVHIDHILLLIYAQVALSILSSCVICRPSYLTRTIFYFYFSYLFRWVLARKLC